MPCPASNASRSMVLIGVTCGHHQHCLSAVVVDDPCLGPPNPVGHTVEALPVRRPDAGVTKPAPVQFRITCAGLAERQTFPRTEVGFQSSRRRRDVEPKRLGGPAAAVVIRALQRRGDDGRDAALLGEELCGGLGLPPAYVGQRRVTAAGIPPLRRQLGLSVAQ